MTFPAIAAAVLLATAALGCPGTLGASDGVAAKKTQRLSVAVAFPLPRPVPDIAHVGRLNRPASFNAPEACQELGPIVASKFVRNPRGWECTSYMVMDDGANPASLFLHIKGEMDRSFSSFRIKLNFGDLSDKELLETAGHLISRFPFDLSGPSRAYLMGKVARLAPFDSALENVRAHLDMENSDERRYNLLVRPDVGLASVCRFRSTAPPQILVLVPAPIACATLSGRWRG